MISRDPDYSMNYEIEYTSYMNFKVSYIQVSQKFS